MLFEWSCIPPLFFIIYGEEENTCRHCGLNVRVARHHRHVHARLNAALQRHDAHAVHAQSASCGSGQTPRLALYLVGKKETKNYKHLGTELLDTKSPRSWVVLV
jgi:ribosomal protein L37E